MLGTTGAGLSCTLRRLTAAVLIVIFVLSGSFAGASAAAGESNGSPQIAAKADALLADLDQNNQTDADSQFKEIKKWWVQHKSSIKLESFDLAMEIDRHIASLSLALIGGNDAKASDSAAELSFALHSYESGAYTNNEGRNGLTLTGYIAQINQAGQLAEQQDWDGAARQVKQLQKQWLSIEGDVVGRSQSVYNAMERDLVLADAYLANDSQRDQASALLKRMAENLEPLAQTGYSWLDAAMIPFREGLEAVLVIGSLSVAAKQSSSRKAKRWIAGGSAAGIALCLAAGIAVSMLFTSSEIGSGNSVLNGWTGVVSSLLLLYVSYWLHRNADVQRWNAFLRSQTQRAASAGRAASFGLLAFFAIVREGLETVLFLIGLAGKMPAGTLVIGLAAGFGMLGVAAWLIRLAGSKVSVRPLFLISSLIVFYLCFKFLGSGIHSLQMAGIIPANASDRLPELAAISLYPSWYSTLPQLLLILLALAAAVTNRFKRAAKNSINPAT
ncbi:FTR1 family protein [Paenibacillus pasadenensis]|uniref:FTR1 family protein n=1 Tax=Paenibacillus pasadenensis TaxID=217090 RepID=UPI00203CC7DB|nr:FTR1 family protein [Paenibacillus pasadenensis]MCM3745743.1 FTR1 family protein [Paenibacillus pasadenensis]